MHSLKHNLKKILFQKGNLKKKSLKFPDLLKRKNLENEKQFLSNKVLIYDILRIQHGKKRFSGRLNLWHILYQFSLFFPSHQLNLELNWGLF